MIVSIDLKPLTDETIAQMGFNAHELWKVKIGTVVFGPFETESLRHYVSDNEHLFENAQACMNNEDEWKPFWTITKFQRRKPQLVSENHPGPFWLMINGLPKGPYSFDDITKKIKASELVMTDHISTTGGDTWNKVYEIQGFDRRAQRAANALPAAPTPTLEKSIEVAAKPSGSSDMLAEMAFIGQQQGKVLQLKPEDISLDQVPQVEASDSLKWGVPVAGALLVAFIATGYFVFHNDDEVDLADSEESSFFKNPSRSKSQPRAVIPDGARAPASASYAQEPRPTTFNQEPQISRYPTHYETHDQVFEEQPIPPEAREPQIEPVVENEQGQDKPQEHSLVDNNPAPEDQSVDAAMNGSEVQQQAEPQAPQVEESGDF